MDLFHLCFSVIVIIKLHICLLREVQSPFVTENFESQMGAPFPDGSQLLSNVISYQLCNAVTTWSRCCGQVSQIWNKSTRGQSKQIGEHVFHHWLAVCQFLSPPMMTQYKNCAMVYWIVQLLNSIVYLSFYSPNKFHFTIQRKRVVRVAQG